MNLSRFKIIALLGIWLPMATLSAQCEFIVEDIDFFDSTRLLTSKPVPIGFLIPSMYETIKGPRLIDEAQAMFSFAESARADSINSFFLTVLAEEYDFLAIESGQNVLLALEDSTVVGLLNFPDRGTFNPKTNMRLYQHTCVVPIDILYRLSFSKIMMIRIEYENKKKTIILSKEQQKELQKIFRCVGERQGLFKEKP